jgi:hypothetical protein
MFSRALIAPKARFAGAGKDHPPVNRACMAVVRSIGDSKCLIDGGACGPGDDEDRVQGDLKSTASRGLVSSQTATRGASARGPMPCWRGTGRDQESRGERVDTVEASRVVEDEALLKVSTNEPARRRSGLATPGAPGCRGRTQHGQREPSVESPLAPIEWAFPARQGDDASEKTSPTGTT